MHNPLNIQNCKKTDHSSSCFPINLLHLPNLLQAGLPVAFFHQGLHQPHPVVATYLHSSKLSGNSRCLTSYEWGFGICVEKLRKMHRTNSLINSPHKTCLVCAWLDGISWYDHNNHNYLCIYVKQTEQNTIKCQQKMGSLLQNHQSPSFPPLMRYTLWTCSTKLRLESRFQ